MLNGSTEVGLGLLCTGGDVCVRPCVCRTFAGPASPPEAGRGFEPRQNLGPKWLGGNGGVPDRHHLPPLAQKSPADSEM